jgi:hypothetical protein
MVIFLVLFCSCSRRVGWGVLLWASEDPAIPSGTVLPVYIRSNIDRVWVAGIPKEYREPGSSVNKFEIPLWQLELAGSRGAAKKRAAGYAEYAAAYAETLQDGLPIRENPDNTARRVYRLRMGQVIKILSRAEGNPAISATGDPLPGEWYRVLTEDGATGYCFSYRLKLFENGGKLLTSPAAAAETDPDLDMVLSKTWSPDWYGAMIAADRIDLEDLEKHWCFSPGEESGTAHLYLPGIDRTFSYSGIRRVEQRRWRFEGVPLEMSLREDTLSVQYTDAGGISRTQDFIVLPNVDNLVVQETERRDTLFHNLYDRGPVFTSAAYGTLSLLEDGQFVWPDAFLLGPRIVPTSVLGRGAVSMGRFLDLSLADQFDGAFSLHFSGIGNAGVTVNFTYILDEQGFHIEYVPPENLEGVTVTRRASNSPVIYFFRQEAPAFTIPEPPAEP